MTERNKSVLFIFLAAVLWSTGGVFIKATSLDAFQTSFWRSLFASLAILILIRPKKLLLDSTTLVASLAYMATLILFVLGTKLTTAANAILLQYTAPIYILVLAHWILNEKITRIGVVTVALCLMGMAIFFLDKLSPEGVMGNLSALCSGIAFALMTVFLRKNKGGEPVSAILLGNVWIVASCAVITLIQHQTLEAFRLTTQDALMTSYLGMFQIAIPYIMFVQAIKHIPALEASLLSMLEPILNPIWVMLFVGEFPSLNAVIGGSVIIGAVALQNIVAARQTARNQTARN
ncbi:MAG: DMT family transporter [Chloroherpetonaceae bacterium]